MVVPNGRFERGRADGEERDKDASWRGMIGQGQKSRSPSSGALISRKHPRSTAVEQGQTLPGRRNSKSKAEEAQS